ncbi:MAG: hypothetical protein KC492_08150, partial [Myxococcales bacterium]|nr:hypothetical protein [Myxococcales bacterium]
SLGIFKHEVPMFFGILNQARGEERDVWPPDIARDIVGTGLFFGYFLSARSLTHFAKLRTAALCAMQQSTGDRDPRSSEYWLRELVDQRGYGGVAPVRFTDRYDRGHALRARCVLAATLLDAMVSRLGLQGRERLRPPGSGGYAAFEATASAMTFDERTLLRAVQEAHDTHPPSTLGSEAVAALRRAFAGGDGVESEELSALCRAVSAAPDGAALQRAEIALGVRCREMWETIRERASKTRVRVSMESVRGVALSAPRENDPGRQAASGEMERKCLGALWQACRCAEDRAVYRPVTDDLRRTKVRRINWAEVALALAQSVPESEDPEWLNSRLGIEARKLTQPETDRETCLQAIKRRAQTVWRGITNRAARLLGQEFGR